MILAIANQKGGVGKTTTATSLGHWLAMRGQRTLVVDMDPQGHVARCLGLQKSPGLYQLLVEELPLGQIVQPARPNLDVVLSDKTSEKIKPWLIDTAYREIYIAEHLGTAYDELYGDYDWILLDLAPGSDILHVGALAAADAFLVPARMGLLEQDGVNEVLRTVASLKKLSQVEPPKFLGVLPTMYDRVTRETQETISRLTEQVGAEALLPPIPSDTHLREAVARGLTIWEYAPDSPAAIGYKNGSRVVNNRGRVGGYLHLGEMMVEAYPPTPFLKEGGEKEVENGG